MARRNQTESAAKAEAGVAAAESPMDRFRSLVRKLVHVPRPELEEQQRRYDADKERRRIERG